MVQPANWNTFLKRNIREARANHPGDYAAALAEVSASWATVKGQRAGTVTDDVLTALQLSTQAREAAVQGAAQRQEAAVQTQGATLETQELNDEEVRGAEAVDQNLIGRDHRDLVMPTAEELGGDDPVWKGGYKIGGREGENSALVWLLLDADGCIVDRRVVKSTTMELAAWKDGTKWSGNIRDVEGRYSMEFVIHKTLCDAQSGGTHFARLRGYRNFPKKFQYRVIGDFCDAGNMEEMMYAYHNAFQHNDRKFEYPTSTIIPAGTLIVPESLVWRMLEQLLKAVLVMEQGSLDGPVLGWQQVVHRDFRTENVFLSTASNSRYPDVKLSDFEFAVETSTTDGFNPGILRIEEPGDRRYRPMEMRTDAQQAQLLEREKEFWGEEYTSLVGERILAAANLWGVGVAIYELMHSSSTERDIMSDAKSNDPKWARWNATVESNYSKALVDLVTSCLMHEPAQRGTAREKLGIIEQTIDDDEGADRMRIARDGAAEEDDIYGGFRYPGPGFSAYALGLKFAGRTGAEDES